MLRTLLWALFGLSVLLVLGAAAAWAVLRSPAAGSWALAQVPGLSVQGSQGTLWGDYRAERVRWQRADGSQITIDGLLWTGAHVRRGEGRSASIAVQLGRLEARSVKVQWARKAGSGKPMPPARLSLPVGLQVDALRVDEIGSNLWVGGSVRQLEGRLALQTAVPGQPGAWHVVEDLTAQWQGWTARLKGRIATERGLQVVAHVSATSALDDFNAEIQGPLSDLLLSARVQVRAGASRTPGAVGAPAGSQPSARISARVQAFEAWPLAQASVNVQALDLQRLLAAWPRTALQGVVQLEPIPAASGSTPAVSLDLQIDNGAVGPWDTSRVPVRQARLRAVLPVAQDRTGLRQVGRQGRLDGELGLGTPAGAPAGRVVLAGTWDLDRSQATQLRAVLSGVDVGALHGRAPNLILQGAVDVSGLPAGVWQTRGQLQGREQRLNAPVQARWAARRQGDGRIDVDQLELTQSGAVSRIKGHWLPGEGGRWQSAGDMALRGIDPAVWMPWPRAAGDASAPTRLAAQVQWTLRGQGTDWRSVRGRSSGRIDDSRLLGVPLQGDWQGEVDRSWRWTTDLRAGNNSAQVQVVGPAGAGGGPVTWAGTRLNARVEAPDLAQLRLWAQTLGLEGLSGRMKVEMDARLDGPSDWQSVGQLDLSELKGQPASGRPVAVQAARARWQLAAPSARTATAAVWRLDAALTGVEWGGVALPQATASLQGTSAQHRMSLNGRLDLPERVDSTGGRRREAVRLMYEGDGQWLPSSTSAPSTWSLQRQRVQVLPVVASVGAAAPAWRPGAGMVFQPFRVGVFGAVLDVSAAAWQGQSAELKVALTPLRVADVLSRWQPRQGWGGDLTVQGQIAASLDPARGWQVQGQFGRKDGDLALSDTSIEGNSQTRLGLRQLQWTLVASQGQWTLAHAVEGRLLGALQGWVRVDAPRPGDVPALADPMSGEVVAQLNNLRPLGAWAPAGWRLAGQMVAKAELSGSLASPRYRGEVQGDKLGASHALQGVTLQDGRLLATFEGSRLVLSSFKVEGAGEEGGSLELKGDADLGLQPRARLSLQADRFVALARADRRAVVSGDAQLTLGDETLALDGRIRVDEGLVDLSRDDAPTVGDDVNVINRPGAQDEDVAAAANRSRRKLQVVLAVDLGERLRLKGRGLDTRLGGQLRLTTPGGQAMLHGTVATTQGTYMAYGQKLVIDRGTVAFTGPVGNPRLDIRAMRAQSPMAASSDVKVGVTITGTAQDPRVRLYSEPSMSETEKLSWLVLGRGPAGLGAADIGLLQTAASALLAGEGGSPKDTLISAVGLDELSVRQTDGAVRDTIVSVGKQVSDRWYLGYERSLNATTGTWQAIYKLAQRFTLRAQTGDDNAVDLIWSWRWGR